MTSVHPVAGRSNIVRAALAAALVLLMPAVSVAADEFPFDQELLLDAARMGRVKRVPMLSIEPNGNATIRLWCKDVNARVQVSDGAMHIETGPLPEALPAMMSDGQCSPERMQADVEMLAALAQVSAWRLQGGTVVLSGATEMHFRPSDH
jgi:heat shock protein HslJ